MLKLNSELKNSALETLKGKWGEVVGTALVYVLLVVTTAIAYNVVMIAAGNAANFAAKYLILFVNYFVYLSLLLLFGYGIIIYFLKHFRGEEKNMSMLLAGFGDFGRVFGTMFLTLIYVCLWSFLLVIPGIIKYYSYAMTPYILADRPELKNNEAIELSMKMMKGNKMKLFLLYLSFIGWYLLSILTLGIGLLWFLPYAQTTGTAFYLDLKDNMANEGVATPIVEA